MPKSLTNHESEYHYFASQLFEANTKGWDDPDLYGLANACRRVIESYFCFKLPKKTNLKEKFEILIKKLEFENDKTSPFIALSRERFMQVTELKELKEAISYYTARACVKLREQKGYAQAIYVFVKTNKFKSNIQQYRNGATYSFVNPTNDTLEITGKATKLMEAIFKKGIEYKKAGIMLLDITQAKGIQESFFTETCRTSYKSEKLMSAMDYINDRYGNETIHSLAQGVSKKWIMNCNNRSPRYTTNWGEIPSIL